MQTCVISPLDHTLITGDTGRQLDPVCQVSFLPHIIWDLKICLGGIIGQVERVLVKTFLGDDRLPVQDGAEFEDKATPVVCGQVNLNVNLLWATRKKIVAKNYSHSLGSNALISTFPQFGLK